MDGTLQSPTGDTAASRLRPVLISAALLLAVLLAFFAWSLIRSQSTQREDLEQRFSDRADVAAAVNEALFTLAGQQQIAVNATRFGGKQVPAQAVEARRAQSNAVYSQIVDARGSILAESVGAPDRPPGGLPIVKKALRTGRPEYSSLMDGPKGTVILESATPFKTRFGPRVEITASRGDIIAGFLNGFLSQLPAVDNARSYVVDPDARLVASPGAKIAAGTALPDRPLAQAIEGAKEGGYGDNRYFTSAPIEGTPWRILLTASKDDLYDTVDTFVPWLIFGTLVLAGIGGLVLLWRVLLASTELARAELSRRHALEINDNVVQRLVIAKYALDRGATETSQQKLAETLRETQQLVTSLLEQKSIEPGALRRGGPAPTEGPPLPPEATRP